MCMPHRRRMPDKWPNLTVRRCWSSPKRQMLCSLMRKQSSREPDAALSTVYVERLLSLMPNAAEEQAFSSANKMKRSSQQSYQMLRNEKTPPYPNRSLRPCLFVQSFRREMSKGNLRVSLCERRWVFHCGNTKHRAFRIWESSASPSWSSGWWSVRSLRFGSRWAWPSRAPWQ